MDMRTTSESMDMKDILARVREQVRRMPDRGMTGDEGLVVSPAGVAIL